MDQNQNQNFNSGFTPMGGSPLDQQPEQKGMSIASMVLGIVSILAWCLPCVGYPVTIAGIVLGVIGMKKGGKGMAIAGIVLCAIFLVVTLINSIAGVAMNLDSLGY